MFDVQATSTNGVNVVSFSPVSPRLCSTGERIERERRGGGEIMNKLNTAQLFFSHSSLQTILFSSRWLVDQCSATNKEESKRSKTNVHSLGDE